MHLLTEITWTNFKPDSNHLYYGTHYRNLGTPRNIYVMHIYKLGICLYKANSLKICWYININDKLMTKEKRTDKIKS